MPRTWKLGVARIYGLNQVFLNQRFITQSFLQGVAHNKGG